MPTPFVSKRAPIYADVPDEKWNDWRWQLSHRLNTAEEIEKVLPLNELSAKHCKLLVCSEWISHPTSFL